MIWKQDDMTIRYLKQGAGPLVILLHGLGGVCEMWTAQQVALTKAGYTSIAIDMPGHGKSSPASLQGCDFMTLAKQVAAFCEDICKHQPFYVIGHSLGAGVSYYLLTQTNLPIKAAIAVDQSPKMLNDDNWHFGFKDWTKQNLPAKLMANSLGKATVKPLDDVVWAKYAPARAAYGHFELSQAYALLKSHAKNDWTTALTHITTPLLIVLGANSPYFAGGFAKWLAAKNQVIQVATIKNSGHLPMAEQSEAFNQAMLLFLQAH